MAQIQKGYEFDSSNPVKNIVTDENLNALVSNASLLNGAIIEQTANAVTADTDIMLLSKAGGLIKQTKGEFTHTINSNIANINTVNAALVDADDVDTVDATLTGNLAVGGNSALTGNLVVTGNVTANGALTSTGVANFTGTLQVNGAVGYVLTEIYEQTITPWEASYGGHYEAVYTSASFTKPSDEIWVFELSANHQGADGYTYIFAGRYGSQTYLTGNYLFQEIISDGQGGGSYQINYYQHRWVVPTGFTFTSETFKIDTFAANGSVMRMFQTAANTGAGIVTGSLASSKFRIYKYKTA